MIKLDLNPAPRISRQFAWVAVVALPLLAGLFTKGAARWYQLSAWNWSHPAVLTVAVIAGVQLIACLAGFRWLTLGLYAVLSLVAFPIGFVLSHVLMAIIYYLVITPIGLLFRLIGRDPLGKRLDRNAATYWHERRAARPAASYFKLY
jgi:hypothetical protein